MPNTGNYVTALEGKSSYVNAKKMTYYGFSKSPCQKCAFNCRSSWAKRKERRVEERDITTPPPRQKTYLMLRIRRRRLGVVGQRTSKESSANVRTVVPVSGVTFRAFSADIDRVSRTVSSLVALVDWRWDQADCYNWTARLVLKGELWLVYNLEGCVSEPLIGSCGVGRNYCRFKSAEHLWSLISDWAVLNWAQKVHCVVLGVNF